MSSEYSFSELKRKHMPNKFYVLYSDAGGCCGSMVSFDEIKIFDSYEEAISFLLEEICRVFDEIGISRGSVDDLWDDDEDEEDLEENDDEEEEEDDEIYPTKNLQEYLNDEEIESYKTFNKLVDAISQEKNEDEKKKLLEEIKKSFNAIFYNTNPSVGVEEWGNLKDFLLSDYFEDYFKEYIKDEKDYKDEDEKEVTKLKKLLDSGEFDENNKQHFNLAISFLEDMNNRLQGI